MHRAIFGTFDRFPAFILEETKGVLPTWLSPVQVNIIPVNNEYHLEYCSELKEKLSNLNIRCELDSRDEKLGYKMRESQTKKIPYTLVIGDKERDGNLVNYRRHGSQEAISVSVEEFIKLIQDEIITRGVK